MVRKIFKTVHETNCSLPFSSSIPPLPNPLSPLLPCPLPFLHTTLSLSFLTKPLLYPSPPPNSPSLLSYPLAVSFFMHMIAGDANRSPSSST